MKIVIGNDHIALALERAIAVHLETLGHTVIHIGTDNEERCDYPVYAKKAAHTVAAGEAELGILICGTGVGMSIAANKVPGIRAVVCSEPYSAKLSREHNNTNILAFGARVVGADLAKMIVDAWLSASYEGGRHARRVAALEENEKPHQM